MRERNSPSSCAENQGARRQDNAARQASGAPKSSVSSSGCSGGCFPDVSIMQAADSRQGFDSGAVVRLDSTDIPSGVSLSSRSSPRRQGQDYRKVAVVSMQICINLHNNLSNMQTSGLGGDNALNIWDFCSIAHGDRPNNSSSARYHIKDRITLAVPSSPALSLAINRTLRVSTCPSTKTTSSSRPFKPLPAAWKQTATE